MSQKLTIIKKQGMITSLNYQKDIPFRHKFKAEEILIEKTDNDLELKMKTHVLLFIPIV